MPAVRFNTKFPIILIEVCLKGKTTRDLMMALDTGASRTIIPFEIAAAIGCDPAKSKKRSRVVTGSGIEIAPLVKVKSVTSLGKTVRNLEVACHDLPQEGYVDGLLGLDFLRRFKLSIHFKQGIVELR